MIINVFNRLRCPRCQKYYKNSDRVFLDVMNTVIHQSCYTLETLSIKDKGTYGDIIEKHNILKEVI